MSVPMPTVPVVNQGLLYVNGLQISPGALNADNLTTATVTIQNGQCRDSTDTNDIDLSSGPYTLNSAGSGVNGLDVGTIAIDLLYAVYVIADSNGYKPSATLLSLNFSQPLLPFGYNMFRRVGAVLTAHASARFVWFKQTGNGSGRNMYYAVPLATALTAGASATLAAFSWATATPANVVPITAAAAFGKVALTSDAGATRTVVFSSDATITIANAATSGEIILSSPASTVTTATLTIPVTPTAGPVLPMTSVYAVSNTAASVAVLCSGYQDLL